MASTSLIPKRVPLPGISSRACEHPADKGALVALRKLKGFDSLIKSRGRQDARRQPPSCARGARLQSPGWPAAADDLRDSGKHAAILAGDYPRRDSDRDAKISEAAQEAADSYADSIATSLSALGKLVTDAGSVVGSVGGWVRDRFSP